MAYNLELVPSGLRGFVVWSLKLKSFLISLAAFVMGLTFFCVVVLRYGFQADLFAYEEWLLAICFWLYFLASAVGTFEKVHINADLLSYVITNPKTAYLRSLLVHLIELIVLAVLIYWSVAMIIDELSFYPFLQSTTALRIPLVIPRAAMVVGFGFMAFYTALHIYIEFKAYKANDPSSSDHPPEIT